MILKDLLLIFSFAINKNVLIIIYDTFWVNRAAWRAMEGSWWTIKDAWRQSIFNEATLMESSSVTVQAVENVFVLKRRLVTGVIFGIPQISLWSREIPGGLTWLPALESRSIIQTDVLCAWSADCVMTRHHPDAVRCPCLTAQCQPSVLKRSLSNVLSDVTSSGHDAPNIWKGCLNTQTFPRNYADRDLPANIT